MGSVNYSATAEQLARWRRNEELGELLYERFFDAFVQSVKANATDPVKADTVPVGCTAQQTEQKNG